MVIQEELEILKQLQTQGIYNPREFERAIQAITSALEKLSGELASKQTSIEWRDPDGDIWVWDEEWLAMRWEREFRRVKAGNLEHWVSFAKEWSPLGVTTDYDRFHRRMWAHYTGEKT